MFFVTTSVPGSNILEDATFWEPGSASIAMRVIVVMALVLNLRTRP